MFLEYYSELFFRCISMYKTGFKLIAAVMGLVLLIGLSSCGAPRKCNGSRGTATDMGTM